MCTTGTIRNTVSNTLSPHFVFIPYNFWITVLELSKLWLWWLVTFSSLFPLPSGKCWYCCLRKSSQWSHEEILQIKLSTNTKYFHCSPLSMFIDTCKTIDTCELETVNLTLSSKWKHWHYFLLDENLLCFYSFSPSSHPHNRAVLFILKWLLKLQNDLSLSCLLTLKHIGLFWVHMRDGFSNFLHYCLVTRTGKLIFHSVNGRSLKEQLS